MNARYHEYMKTLHDLFIHELQDLYSAENQILALIPRLVEAAHSPKLKEAFQSDQTEVEGQVKKLEEIGRKLEADLNGKYCMGMEGLIKEAEEMIEEDADAGVKGAGLIAVAQRIEHYEIAGYGTAMTFAGQMNHTDVQKLLEEILAEEKEGDKKLSELATSGINQEAQSS